MTLKEASVTALSILKQVMEEKLNSTNVEVSFFLEIYYRMFLVLYFCCKRKAQMNFIAHTRQPLSHGSFYGTSCRGGRYF